MSRMRRVFLSGYVYEFCFRAKEGLPLPTWELINLLINSALARTQRDDKITICHHLWMGNHVHIIAIVHDAQEAVDFMQELQKKLTESIKRLLGKEHLNIWEGSAMMAIITDPEKVIDRLAYLYANPASADLVDTIEDYPGVSSWQEYKSSPHQIDAKCSKKIPWVRQPLVPKLSSRRLTRIEDRAITASVSKASSKKTHNLTVYPNAWMKAFGITESKDVEVWNKRAVELIRQKEDAARESRGKKKVLGVERLRREAIFKEHIPKEKREKIFVLSSDVKLRIKYINYIKTKADEACALYAPWTNGHQVGWPPGVFRPPLRPVANCIEVMASVDSYTAVDRVMF